MAGECLHSLIEEQARLRPEAIAVLEAQEQLSYRDLNRRATGCRGGLQQLGVGPDVLVGVAAERSIGLVVALLGVLKAGGAYLPLDPEYPEERLAYMMADSGLAGVGYARGAVEASTGRSSPSCVPRSARRAGLRGRGLRGAGAGAHSAPAESRLLHLYLRLHWTAERSLDLASECRAPPADVRGALSFR